ncbi:LPS export ABC transporter ATP-binding protein [Flammeovirga yaeyamensis]|uniref:Lipopolysaccharide export system ATP-binding protein LptB n=1 Tax=Flammeovirga yaeyamensis TaxID=367791 RepID=A0AAX1N130_9BACT|nr:MULTISPECIES: LPS export ABC transporter ATP-binding protein [Flammeovirga]ANQ48521.1 LPS export ABC transporter ATP-binding protein [Flammeovirga sp. MY04]MBB3696414.1 lipopolysaccharide export system ATP-binding protein [Flammeovirga yaeyamensis]NMF35093.1 LPS export ABC transporter ATP-binding protein [Flammeovirga yaeyamensis]QWG00086.1 LPS export ABC transporter ATP-binding protein [Flammeovirga yaeyamensis]
MILKADNLIKHYGKRTVVNDVSIKVEQGEIVGLLGPNGAGKTTCFYMIVGLIKPNNGQIHLEAENITKLPMYRRAQKGVGYLAQEPSVFRGLTVEENIMLPLEMEKISKAEKKQRVDNLLEEFSLTHVRDNLGMSLSGGERRRTEIARTLATNPSFVLLDEPFAGVDPIAVEEIQRIVYNLKKKNIGILITDHNVTETLSITDRVYILQSGVVFRDGTPDQLINDPEVRKAYFGEYAEYKKKDFSE